MNYTIRSFKARDGERFSQIYDSAEGGFPLFYPTAFTTRTLRLKYTPNTQKDFLEAVKRILEWEARLPCGLDIRFQKLDFLKPYELDQLAIHLKKSRRGKQSETISSGKANTYISYARKYLRWLADEVITDSNTVEIQSAIAAQYDALGHHITRKAGSKSAYHQRVVAKCLSEIAREQLLALFRDPYLQILRRSDRAPRMRNVLMLRLLYESGMRRGELLSLKLRNFSESSGGPHASLVIERNHSDEFDVRVNQPVAKTDGRIVPISQEAERQLLEYLDTYRAETANVGYSDEDFIFVRHRAGRQQGAPISISAFDQGIRGLRRGFPALCLVHPHLLRHDWNFRFSKLADEHRLKTEKEQELRALLMGWSAGSDMAKLYNRRHTQEQATKYGLIIANDTARNHPSHSQEREREREREANQVALEIAQKL